MKNKRSEEEIKEAISNSFSIAETCRKLNIKPIGGNYKVIHKAIEQYNIDTSHFTGQGWNIGLKFIPKGKKPLDEILTENSFYQSSLLKKRLIEEGHKLQKCEICGNEKWNGKNIPLEIHHINGKNNDNRIGNLQLVCPNCHAQTENYRGRNKKVQKTFGFPT